MTGTECDAEVQWYDGGTQAEVYVVQGRHSLTQMVRVKRRVVELQRQPE